MTILCVVAESVTAPFPLLEQLIARLHGRRQVRVAYLLIGKRVRQVTKAEREAVDQIESWVKHNMRGNLPEVPGITRLLDVFILNTVSRDTRLTPARARNLLARTRSKRTVRIAKLILGLPVRGATKRDHDHAARCRAWAKWKRDIAQAKNKLRHSGYPFSWK